MLHRLVKPAGLAALEAVEYTHRDHLGSIDAVSDASGSETANLAYDPYGQRREGGYSAQSSTIADLTGSSVRGYTDHEHLDRTGFVHMNGRVYDPRIGRFLQAHR